MILLDTCVLLWLSDPDHPLPDGVKDAIRACPPAERFVSAISGFEIGFKCALGKLALPMAPNLWFEESCARRGLQTLPVTVSVAMRASQLPPHHRDPADRFIISTAMEFGLKIATPDSEYRKYDVESFWG